MGSCGLILGGSSSGKSMYAQRLARSLAGTRPLYYLRTSTSANGTTSL